MTSIVNELKEGANSFCQRLGSLITGQPCDDKKGMEILQFIVIAAIVAVILFLTLPKLSESLQKSNEGTIDSITTLQDTVLNGAN